MAGVTKDIIEGYGRSRDLIASGYAWMQAKEFVHAAGGDLTVLDEVYRPGS